MLRQHGPVQASRLQHYWDDGDDDVAAEVDRALQDLQASPIAIDVLRPSSPLPDPASARLPSLGLSFPSLTGSSSPTLSRQVADGHDGSEAFAALRSALHLREFKLMQPQHAGLSAARQQADDRLLGSAHQLADLAPPAQLLHGLPEPGSPSLLELQTPREPVPALQVLDGSIASAALVSGEAGAERAEENLVPMASAASVRQVTRSVHLSSELPGVANCCTQGGQSKSAQEGVSDRLDILTQQKRAALAARHEQLVRQHLAAGVAQI